MNKDIVFIKRGTYEGELYLEGWYYRDETEALTGPYETEQQAQFALNRYVETYLWS